MTSLIGSLPLQIVCQLLVSGNLTITENITSDVGEIPREIPPLAVIPDNYELFSTAHLGVTYKIYNKTRSWNEARKICISKGSRLAVIDSWEKFEIIKAMNTQNVTLYIGIHNMFNHGEWIRADNGLPVTSVPWLPGVPGTLGNCLVIAQHGEGVRDTNCNWGYQFVCETTIIN